MPETRTEISPATGRRITFNWVKTKPPTNNEIVEIESQLSKAKREEAKSQRENQPGLGLNLPTAREAALTVLEPFYPPNIYEAGKTVGRGVGELASVPFSPNLPTAIERGAKGIEEVGGGVMGVSAPIIAGAAPYTIPILGPLSKALGYGAEKVGEGITAAQKFTAPAFGITPEYVEQTPDVMKNLKSLASQVAPLAAVGPVAKRLIPRAKTTEEIPPEVEALPPLSFRTPEELMRDVLIQKGELPAGQEISILEPGREQLALPPGETITGEGFTARPGPEVRSVGLGEFPPETKIPLQYPEVTFPEETVLPAKIPPTPRELAAEGIISTEPTALEKMFPQVESPIIQPTEITGQRVGPRPEIQEAISEMRRITEEIPEVFSPEERISAPTEEAKTGLTDLATILREETKPVSPKITPKGGARASYELGRNLEANAAETEQVKQQIKETEQRLKDLGPPEGIEERRAPDWIPKQSTEALQAMKEGAVGKVREAIDRELNNRIAEERTSSLEGYYSKELKEGIKEESAPEITPDKQDYLSELGHLEGIVRAGEYSIGRDLVPLVRQAKKLGLAEEDVIQDLMDKGISYRKVNAAVSRIYKPEGEILYAMGFDPKRMYLETKDLFLDVAEGIGKILDKTKSPAATQVVKKATQESYELGMKDNYAIPPIDGISRQPGPTAKRIASLAIDATWRGKQQGGEFRGALNIALKPFEKLKVEEAKNLGYRIAKYRGTERVITRDNELRYGSYLHGRFVPKPGIEITMKEGNLIDALEGKSRPANAQIAKVVAQLQKLDNIAMDRMEKSGVNMVLADGTRIPFTRRPSYYPHSFTRPFFESLERNPKLRDEVIADIAKERKISLSKAEQVMKDSRYFGEIFTPAQRQRLSVNFDYIRDIDTLYSHYDTVGMRLGQSEVLGPLDVNGKFLNDLIKQSGSEGANTSYILEMFRGMLNRNPRSIFSSADRRAYKMIGGLNTAMYLSRFVISNTAQVVLWPALATTKGMARGIANSIANFEQARSRAINSGSLEESMLEDFGAAQSVIGKYYGMKAHETAMRTFSSEIGRESVADLFNYLKTAKKTGYAQKVAKGRLEYLTGQKWIELSKQPSLTEPQLQRGAYMMSRGTQGVIDPLEIPAGWRDKGLFVDLALQYKRFAYIQVANTIRAYKIDPVRTLATLTGVAPIVGEIVGNAKQGVSGAVAGSITGEGAWEATKREIERRGEGRVATWLEKELGLESEDAKIIGRYIDNINQSFALGIIGDFLQAISMGPDKQARWAVGGWATLTELLSGLFQAGLGGLSALINQDGEFLEEAFDPLIGQAERAIPLAGPTLKRSQEEMEGTGGGGMNYPTVNLPSYPTP